jgi:hypothetical protein
MSIELNDVILDFTLADENYGTVYMVPCSLLLEYGLLRTLVSFMTDAHVSLLHAFTSCLHTQFTHTSLYVFRLSQYGTSQFSSAVRLTIKNFLSNPCVIPL